MKKIIRDSNFELLRIFAIMLVIVSHFNVHSYWMIGGVSDFSLNLFMKFLFSVGCIANIIFIILTGYFMVKSRIKIQKIISLILEMYFYSIIILLFAKFIFNMEVSWTDLRSSLLPFPFGNWFVVAYIVLYLLIPFINKAVENFGRKQLLELICTCLLVFSIMPILTSWAFFSNFVVFPVAYLIGAYIKLYVGEINKKRVTKYLVVTVALIACSIALIYGTALILQKPELVKHSTYFLVKNSSPLVIAAATFIFLIFRDAKVKPSKIINRLASSVLGIYLIHENVFMRRLLWGGDFISIDIYNTNPLMFILLATAKSLLVFAGCLAIDQLRIVLFGKTEKLLANAIYRRIVAILTKIKFYDIL